MRQKSPNLWPPGPYTMAHTVGEGRRNDALAPPATPIISGSGDRCNSAAVAIATGGKTASTECRSSTGTFVIARLGHRRVESRAGRHPRPSRGRLLDRLVVRDVLRGHL